ncbi:hypothetical protein HDV63DRAFT_307252 [Trichoderma sp. SZMC 28014]
MVVISQHVLFFADTRTVKATGISSLLTVDARRTTDFSGLGYYTPEEMAQTLAFLAGLTLLIFGALRLGWLVDWIPKAALDAFATAASLKLIIGQLPALLGIIGVSNMGHYLSFWQMSFDLSQRSVLTQLLVS